ncbi:MAG TPA: hypothetical protein VFR23_10345 [Jiangellaceae bacterium]|nr:hypothetical protein [Jiangellaceae bacterium]
MKTTIAVIRVNLRSLRGLIFGGDRSGLTTPCDGRCDQEGWHTGHLAPGALEYLGRRK